MARHTLDEGELSRCVGLSGFGFCCQTYLSLSLSGSSQATACLAFSRCKIK